ncbi:response regulator [Arcicella aquatica]|uniref:Response regulator n=1 Tax=Arcicella aquatica TaxID=217141 RepID=A0ABU5QV40_9BACT|nr:response regulator [Arcicella aquatica]MEA5260211.1 response regulator [Arcicella aquatica]
MKNENKIRIFLVDDDVVFLKSLEIEFLQLDTFIVETYITGELCLENLSHNPDIIILDYLLDGIDKHAMNGIQVLDEIKAFDVKIPVVMLSQQDRIDVAINCMHHHAYDYVVKSETAFFRLQQIISTTFKYHKMENELNWYMARM